jgi:hypothetical protein
MPPKENHKNSLGAGARKAWTLLPLAVVFADVQNIKAKTVEPVLAATTFSPWVSTLLTLITGMAFIVSAIVALMGLVEKLRGHCKKKPISQEKN